MISEGCGQGLSWERIAELAATIPAWLRGLAPRKGEIAIGVDADLVIVDHHGRWDVTSGDLRGAHHRPKFEGRSFQGRILHKIRRDAIVYDRDAPTPILGERGSGHFVPARYE